MSTRAEHLAWCKQRALEYVDAGDLQNAYASMASDLGKHPETAGHPGIELGMMQLVTGHLRTASDMRDFIEGVRLAQPLGDPEGVPGRAQHDKQARGRLDDGHGIGARPRLGA